MNYIARLTAAQQHFPAGELCEVAVAHEKDCGYQHGAPLCLCKPDIIVTTSSGDRFAIDEDGQRKEMQ